MEHPRCTARFAFSAAAEVIRGDSVELPSVSDLSQYGCYLSSTAQFPRGTRVTIKIFSHGGFFEAPATVLYSGPTLGMGLAFREVKPIFLDVLKMASACSATFQQASVTKHRRQTRKLRSLTQRLIRVRRQLEV
jgi:hypothetical protein